MISLKNRIMAQYISKSALVAEIERRLRLLVPKMTFHQQRVELEKLLSFIDTLEVKEMDLDNDLFEEVYSHLDGIKDTADRMTSGNFMHHRAAIKFSANTIAKVLEVIGLKAQKGDK